MSDQIKSQYVIRWQDAKPVEMLPGITRRTLGESTDAQIIEVRATAGAVIPHHRHMNQQDGYLVSGEIEFTIGGETTICKPGDSWAIPGDVPHSAIFPVDSVVIECFSPPREDYR
jgi:quercetin dioxygenase-like cupin family protein